MIRVALQRWRRLQIWHHVAGLVAENFRAGRITIDHEKSLDDILAQEVAEEEFKEAVMADAAAAAPKEQREEKETTDAAGYG